jgi:hypothetical protein
MAQKNWLVSLSALVVMAGCAAQSSNGEDDVPDVDDADGLEATQLIVNVNAQGTWTADAHQPTTTAPQGTNASMKGRATFTGPAGATRRMGACLLQIWGGACNTVADCNNSPAGLPAGGFRYCTAPNNVGQKVCAFRPGPASSWCEGTPALAGNPPVAPGLFDTGYKLVPVATQFITYACFEGCAASDPSSSSAGRSAPSCGVPGRPLCP